MYETAVFAAVKNSESVFVWWIPEETENNVGLSSSGAGNDGTIIPAGKVVPFQETDSQDGLESSDNNGSQIDGERVFGEDELVGWEILRYRQVPGIEAHDEWHLKCKSFLSGGHHRSTMIVDLATGCLYRFSVRAIYRRGAPSIESRPSEPVMLESFLPNGWLRMYDDDNKYFYYANFRTKQSRWTRPDLDPAFLDDSIRLLFSNLEMDFLFNLYEELIRRFGTISSTNFRMQVLVKVGEFLADSVMDNMFANFTRRSGEASRYIEIATWYHFMSVMAYLKLQRIKAEEKEYLWKHPLMGWYYSVGKNEGKKKFTDPPRGKKAVSSWVPSIFRRATNLIGGVDYGNWKEKYDPLLKRYYYIDKFTEGERWDMPYEVRTYISIKTHKKVSKVFDDYDIETLRQYFVMLDRTQVGALDKYDLLPIVNVLRYHIFSTPKGFLRLAMRTVDKDGTGFLNFEEFTTFMYFIVSRSNKGVWKKVNFEFDYNTVVHQLFTAPNPLEGLKKKRRGRWSSRNSGNDNAGGDNNQSAASGNLRLGQLTSASGLVPRSTTDPLLSAIGLNIIANYKHWQRTLSTGGGMDRDQSRSKNHHRGFGGSSQASSYAGESEGGAESTLSYMKEFMLPGDEDRGLRHGGSCFCGCRQFDRLTVMQMY